MRFEWDAAKAASNLDKHGVSFDEATRAWDDADMMLVPMLRDAEARVRALGSVDGNVIAVVFTMRGTSARIISARDASRQERRRYVEG